MRQFLPDGNRCIQIYLRLKSHSNWVFCLFVCFVLFVCLFVCFVLVVVVFTFIALCIHVQFHALLFINRIDPEFILKKKKKKNYENKEDTLLHSGQNFSSQISKGWCGITFSHNERCGSIYIWKHCQEKSPPSYHYWNIWLLCIGLQLYMSCYSGIIFSETVLPKGNRCKFDVWILWWNHSCSSIILSKHSQFPVLV